MLNLLRYELASRRWGILGWGIGMGVWGLFTILVFPEMAAQLANFEIPEFYSAFGDFSDFTSLEGFLSAEFLLWLPLLVGIYAISSGTAALGGEEESGTLELLLAQPLKRWQLLLVKALAIALALLLILVICSLIAYGGYASIQAEIESDISGFDLLLAIFNSWPILLFYATLGLWLGAYLPRRRYAVAVGSVALFGGYFLETLAGMAESTEALQKFSPFHYYDARAALTQGLEAESVLFFLGFSALFLALAVLSFQRRNVTVGTWPWQRARLAD